MSTSRPRPAAARGPASWRAPAPGAGLRGAIDHLLSLLVALVLGAWAARRHLSWAAADHGLPVGDAPGHVMIAMRWWMWWTGLDNRAPNEPFPPTVYLSLLWARLTQGDSFDALQVAMAGWSALLVGGAAWAAARGGGGAIGALLAGLLVLRAPQATQIARQFLLDGPATAALLLTLGAAWWSRGFRRPLPSLLAGLLGGGLAVVKYSLLPWLLAPVALWSLALALRWPAALLPLALTAAHLAFWGDVLWARREHRGDLDLPHEPLLIVALASLLLLGMALLLPRRRPAWAWEGLRRGLGVSLACHAALALLLSWLWWGMGAMWGKVRQEALVEVRSAGWPQASGFGLANLVEGVPLAGWALLAALAGIGLAGGRGDRDRAARCLSALVQALAAALVGTWMLSRSLPIDMKYYIPVAPLVAVGLAAGLGAHPLTRRGLAPLACAALLFLVLRIDHLPTRDASGGSRPRAQTLLWRLPATWAEAPTPVVEDWEGAAETAVTAALAAWPSTVPGTCGGYLVDSPSLRVVEDRAFMALGTLAGQKDELWARPRPGLPLCGGISVLGAGGRRPGEGPPQGGGRDLPEGARILAEASPTEGVRVLAWSAAAP